MDGEQDQSRWPLGKRLVAMMERRRISQVKLARDLAVGRGTLQNLLSGRRPDGKDYNADPVLVVKAAELLSTHDDNLDPLDALRMAKVDPALYRIVNGRPVVDSAANEARRTSPYSVARRRLEPYLDRMTAKQVNAWADLMEAYENPYYEEERGGEPVSATFRDEPRDDEGPGSSLAGDEPGPDED